MYSGGARSEVKTSGASCRKNADVYSLLEFESQLLQPSLRGALATKQSILSLRCGMDRFAEPVIGRRFAPTRWLAMTLMGQSSFPSWLFHICCAVAIVYFFTF